MEETGGYYSKGNKPDKEQPKLHGLIYRLLKKKVKLMETESGVVVAKG